MYIITLNSLSTDRRWLLLEAAVRLCFSRSLQIQVRDIFREREGRALRRGAPTSWIRNSALTPTKVRGRTKDEVRKPLKTAFNTTNLIYHLVFSETYARMYISRESRSRETDIAHSLRETDRVIRYLTANLFTYN